nr:MAG TPA: hypothetical protein [Caudoviricetes sp.]
MPFYIISYIVAFEYGLIFYMILSQHGFLVSLSF